MPILLSCSNVFASVKDNPSQQAVIQVIRLCSKYGIGGQGSSKFRGCLGQHGLMSWNTIQALTSPSKWNPGKYVEAGKEKLACSILGVELRDHCEIGFTADW